MLRLHPGRRGCATVYPNKRRAVTAIGTAVSAVVLLSFVALAVDVGHMYGIQSELQNAADVSALAGASAIGGGAVAVRARVLEYVAKHDGMATPDTQEADIVLGHWDKNARYFTPAADTDVDSPDAVRVTTQMSQARGNPASLFFARAMGIQTADISASATATFGTIQPWNIAITQDITGSFRNELDEAKLADQALLDCIKEHTGDDTQVGLVAFTGYGKVITPMMNVNDAYVELSDSITGLNKCGASGMPPCSGTNIGAGIDAAIGLLQNLDSPYPPAIIVVSDGMPNSSLNGYSDQDLADWAVNSADNADAMGISVFTLFYGGNDTSSGAKEFLAGLVRGRGTAHYTVEASEMATELQAICEEGLSLMLVE